MCRRCGFEQEEGEEREATYMDGDVHQVFMRSSFTDSLTDADLSTRKTRRYTEIHGDVTLQGWSDRALRGWGRTEIENPSAWRVVWRLRSRSQLAPASRCVAGSHPALSVRLRACSAPPC